MPNFSDRIGEDDGFFVNESTSCGKSFFGHCQTVRLQTAVSLKFFTL